MTDESVSQGDDGTAAQESDAIAPRWQPIGPVDRRVLGVLLEKAKTTPDVYPMSLNGIVTGCNQKSNRHPVMQLEADDVEESLERLRHLGAVGLIQGMGRVQKYRHYAYEWLGVDKMESAVMAELLLRGAQTEGELRGRAARMEAIADVAALRPILVALQAKGLLLSLTPEGRGHVVSHALYNPRELEHLKAQHAAAGIASTAAADEEGPQPARGPTAAAEARTMPPDPAQEAEAITAIRQAVEELRAEVAQLRNDVEDLAAALQRLRSDLGA